MKDCCKKSRLDAYFDDAVSDSENTRVQQHLENCPTCKDILDHMALQGELLREDLFSTLEKVDFTGFEDRVMQRIHQEKSLSTFERLGVYLREFAYRYRTVWITSVVTACLVLAVLYPFLSTKDILEPPNSEPVHASAHEMIPAGAAEQASTDNQVIIDSLEYAGQRSMIFTVSKNNTTVIWLYDFDQAAEYADEGDDI